MQSFEDSTDASPVKDGQHKVDSEVSEKPALKEYSRAELYNHNKKDDAWLVVENDIYDVTNYLDHPGGRRVLERDAGKDVTIAWRLVHMKKPSARPRLKDFRIGTLREEDRQDYDNIKETTFARAFPYIGGAVFLGFLALMVSQTELAAGEPEALLGLILGVVPSLVLIVAA